MRGAHLIPGNQSTNLTCLDRLITSFSWRRDGRL